MDRSFFALEEIGGLSAYLAWEEFNGRMISGEDPSLLLMCTVYIYRKLCKLVSVGRKSQA